MFRRTQAFRDGRVHVFLALGYLIWSLLPHAHFLVHAHADGELAHSHLSFHDLKLRNQTLVAVNPESADEAGLEGEPGSSASEPGFKPLTLRHGHFTEDQNILAVGMLLAYFEPAPLPRTSPTFPTLAPRLPYSGPPQARGPPAAA